jgi:AcrR family transcriptional regulator
LIEAAIYCLRSYGYSATSTSLVAEVAELSRGAMLHQFGTKVDLMLAVAKHVVEEQNQFFADALRDYRKGHDRFAGLTDVTWEALSQPSAIALLEIMMASRSDAELAEKFPNLAAHLADLQREGAWQVASQAGITDRAAVDAMGALHRAAMQGLSVLLMFSPDPKSLDPALNLLRWYKEQLAQYLIANDSQPGYVSPVLSGPVKKSPRPKPTDT